MTAIPEQIHINTRMTSIAIWTWRKPKDTQSYTRKDKKPPSAFANPSSNNSKIYVSAICPAGANKDTLLFFFVCVCSVCAPVVGLGIL